MTSLEQTPVRHDYQLLDEIVARLAAAAMPVGFDNGPFIEVNTYHQAGYDGTYPTMMARRGVVDALRAVAALCGNDAKIVVFDAFRTRATQLYLFNLIRDQIAAANPTWTPDEVSRRTRQFVAHPYEVSRFKVAPHNSGGAVDITLMLDGVVLDMGTGFDEVSALSRTDAFEAPHDPMTGIDEARWLEIRSNRRLLFNAMKSAGFVNYDEEWWHYDLGDCIWSQTLGVDWYYASMEDELATKGAP